MEFHLADLFEQVVDSVPGNEALVAGSERRTYAELDVRANRLAHHLVSSGVEAGQHVAIYAYNRVEWIEALIACFKIRAVPININFRYVEDELIYIFDDADIVATVYERSFTPLLEAIQSRLPLLKSFTVIEDGSDHDSSALNAFEYEKALAESSPERDFTGRSSDDVYMIYTGGTTGMPKGTMWRHEDIFFAAMQGGNPSGDPIKQPEELGEVVKNSFPLTTVCPPPMMHGGGTWTCMITFFTGGKFILYTGKHFDADEVVKLTQDEKGLSLMLVGDAMARPIADVIETGKYKLDGLMVVSSGGAILSQPVKNKLKALLPNRMILDSFGASETGHNGAVMDMGDEEAAGPRFTLSEHTQILDENLVPLKPGSPEIGRLARSGHIPLGYYKDQKKTDATFKTDSNGVRWVIPGDFAQVLEDGSVQLMGRGSGCINTGGEKVFPEEVEAALKAHDDVFDAVVVGVPDERFGQRVAAIVHPRQGKQPSMEDLAAFCSSKIARYKAPRELILVDEIKRTPAAKPDYRAAKALALKTLGLEEKSA
ncbi:acyl-CoA synthetase [Endozoicomonas arenosclerae]|uniref:acyl-CoA synthetase n=1 Tax=Endozoicomonas arenosclerae TaxID=1633495 RepID=UPI00078278A4|nr:acyl-CoA synthetase [Endozoicomonas arenosclerae]